MSASKHTPGEWAFYEQAGSVEGEPSGYGIKAPAPHHWVIPPLNINPYDVRVMSASKELLAALEDLRDSIYADEGMSRLCNDQLLAAERAVIKARGSAS